MINIEYGENLLSIVTESTPRKAELIYTVNEKENAIAPKITQKGASNLQEEITKTFIQTSSDTILSYINQFGVELEKNKPQLKALIDTIIDIDNKMPEIGQDIDNIYAEALILQKCIQKVQSDVPILSDALDKTLGIAKTGDEYLGKTGDSLRAIPPIVKADLALIKNKTDTAKTLLNGLKDFELSDNSYLRQVLVTAKDRYRDSTEKLDHILSLLRSINGILNNKVIGDFIGTLSSIRGEIVNQQSIIDSMINTIDKGGQVLSSDINSAIQLSNKISESMDSAINSFDTEAAPAIDASMKNFAGVSDNSLKMMKNIQNNIPLLDSLLQGTSTGAELKVKGLKEVKDKFPKIQQDIHSNSEKLRELQDDKKFDEVVKILKRDAKNESEFLAEPIDLKQKRLFPIPNYGSAMSPFYTTLALWVGAFILLSLLSVEVKSFEDGAEIASCEQFFGRYFTFATIAIMQSLVITLGNLFLLKTYVVAPLVYVVFGVYISVVFIMIIYTLVSVLGNIGKALAMVFMVLQVSASGGTFPIELMPRFFQYINPMMAFTYAIGGMREAVAGILRQSLIKNITALSVYFLISLAFGVFLKEKANKISEKFVKQFKESGLAE